MGVFEITGALCAGLGLAQSECLAKCACLENCVLAHFSKRSLACSSLQASEK